MSLRPKKQLGQNFLTRDHYARVMCESAEISEKDTIIEIGPGKGILTSVLLEKAGVVIAVEKDKELMPLLEERFKKEIREKKLQIIEEDIRTLDIGHSVFPKKYKVVANIPYYITGELFRLFLTAPRQPESMTLLVQKEVAERILARDEKESLLSISVKVYGEPKIITRVAAGNFFPKPKVDSAIIHISNISKNFFKPLCQGDTLTLEEAEKKFFEIVHAGFAHKRKQLIGNLEAYLKKQKNENVLLSAIADNSTKLKQRLERALQKQNLPLTVRAEDLNLQNWKNILLA